ncbi:MAG: response regulator receiver protein [Desulfuromonadaceae bacterium]|nr:response regulator receiver protein [Desulfuromonadaceae bacterium]
MVTAIIAHNRTDSATLQRIVHSAECNSDIATDITQAVHALREHKVPVMLLGHGFSGSDTLELISLFKQVNKRVKIILLADTDSVAFLRKARSAGIFYHALEPETEEDITELTLALEGARDASLKQQSSILGRIAQVVPILG